MTNGPGWCGIIYCLKNLMQSTCIHGEQDRLQGHKKVIAELCEYLFRAFMVTESYNARWLSVTHLGLPHCGKYWNSANSLMLHTLVGQLRWLYFSLFVVPIPTVDFGQYPWSLSSETSIFSAICNLRKPMGCYGHKILVECDIGDSFWSPQLKHSLWLR